MEEQTKASLVETASRAGNLLGKLDPETEEELNWFLEILQNQHWENVKYASDWDEVIRERAIAEWLEGTGKQLRYHITQLRDRCEDALK